MGREIGEVITQLLRTHPELAQKLEQANIDDYLENPDLLGTQIKKAYQDSWILRKVMNRYGKSLIRILPDDTEPVAAEILSWLNQK